MNTIKYMTGLLTFYLKGEISTDQNFLKLKIPNTILALIPLGARKDNIPVQQVATVSSSFRLLFKRLLAGLALLILGIVLFSESIVFGLIVVIWAACNIITSFMTELLVTTTSGMDYYIPFLIFEKAKASQAENMIQTMISNRLNDTNNRQVAEAQTNAIVNAINNK